MKHKRREHRDYGQACALATTLDILGERWTLLLIRELMAGPRRFRDLLANLSGIGSNLLAARLSFLQRNRIIERVSTLPSSSAYRLTEAGRALEPALVELARWGNRYGRPPRMNDHWSPFWNNLAFKARFDGSKVGNLRGVFSFSIGGYEHYFVMGRKRIKFFEGIPPNYHVRMECTPQQFQQLASAPHDRLFRIMEQEKLQVQGNLTAFCRFLEAFT